MAAPDGVAGRALTRHQAEIGHQMEGALKPPAVADLRNKGDGDIRFTPRSACSAVTTGASDQVGRSSSISFSRRRTRSLVRRTMRRVSELLLLEPAHVARPPGRLAREMPPMLEQEG